MYIIKTIIKIILSLTLLLIVVGSATAQEDVNITIFIDHDSLTVSVTGNQIVSLQGIGFEVERNGRESFYLEDYPSIAGFPFNATRAPICFRLLRDGSQTTSLPLECSADRTVIQRLSESDVFWVDTVSNTTRTLQLLSGAQHVDFCLAGQSRCNVLFRSPTFTATPEPPPTIEIISTPLPDETVVPLATATSDAYSLAFVGVEANTDWTRIVEDMNGTDMVLVPVGCFMMGREDGANDEQPINEVCFDKPFWIDRTEVTRGMYEACVRASKCEGVPSSEYSSQVNQPINRVTWFQARFYCAWRDARLPTEAEWEYSARGPDGLFYPWGNEFVEEYVVYGGNSDESAPVGNREEGASWVGALDMSGNVLEWLNTIYGDRDEEAETWSLLYTYPYNSEDGREENSNDRTLTRVRRGGSFDIITYSTDTFSLNSVIRRSHFPNYGGDDTGFRCARSY